MFEPIRQWFLCRVSEPALVLIRARFKAGPIAAVAIAVRLAVLGQVMVVVPMLVSLWVLGGMSHAADFERTSRIALVFLGAWVFYSIVAPMVISYDLMAVSLGKKSKLTPWTIGFAHSEQRSWWHIPLDLALVAVWLLILVFDIVNGFWAWLPVAMAAPLYSLIECVKSAIWQNQSVRGLVRASTPFDLS